MRISWHKFGKSVLYLFLLAALISSPAYGSSSVSIEIYPAGSGKAYADTNFYPFRLHAEATKFMPKQQSDAWVFKSWKNLSPQKCKIPTSQLSNPDATFTKQTLTCRFRAVFAQVKAVVHKPDQKYGVASILERLDLNRFRISAAAKSNSSSAFSGWTVNDERFSGCTIETPS